MIIFGVFIIAFVRQESTMKRLNKNIATKNEELLYTFNFKENGKVEIIDYQEEKTLRWNEKNKKNIQEKLEKIIF